MKQKVIMTSGQEGKLKSLQLMAREDYRKCKMAICSRMGQLGHLQIVQGDSELFNVTIILCMARPPQSINKSATGHV